MQLHASMCSGAHDPEEILRLKEEMSCCVQHYVGEHSEQSDGLHTAACVPC